MAKKQKVQEIGGWLVVFLVGLFFATLLHFYYLVNIFDSLKSLADFEAIVPGVSNVFSVLHTFELIGMLILIVLGFRAGYDIFKKRVSAINTARYYAASIGVFAVIDLLWTNNAYSAFGWIIFPGQVYYMVGAVSYSIIWTLYFSKSSRVKKTFVVK